MDNKALDLRGAKCPIPIVKAKQALDGLKAGDVLDLLATDPGSVQDFQGWAKPSKLALPEEQRTENEPDGRVVYVQVLERKP